MRKFAIDLFCGAGGVTCGLIQAGYTVVAGVDKEGKCRQTYLQNKNRDRSDPIFLDLDLFPSTSEYPDGQQELAVKKLRKILRKHEFSKMRGDKLLLAICAPCQPFTKITRIKLSKQRVFDQSRDRNLLLTSLNIVKGLKPDVVFCENVEGVLADGGVMTEFSQKLKQLNFNFSVKIINTEKFGIPQRRRRTIGIGYNHKKILDLPSIPDSDDKVTNPTTVQEVIGDLPPIAAGEVDSKIPNHRTRALNDINLKRISCAPPGKSNSYLKNTPYGDLSLPCHQRLARPSFTDTYTRMAGDQPAPTITTKFLSITNGRFGHYDVQQHRAISIKEGALLQTFPKKYVFYPEDNMNFSATLIGNAVPPKIVKFFGKYIARTLEKNTKKLSKYSSG